MLSNLGPDAHILDMGAGWGLSTENIAYTGAKVTALDINDDFINLIKDRSMRRNLDVDVIQSSFDEFDVNCEFDAIYFYECLHHCVDVEKLLKKCKSKLKPNGKIIFAGEPVTCAWWGQGRWGMRLDAESVYVARKFGWFETGWSEDFIKGSFNRAGLELKLIQGIGLDHGYIGYAEPIESYSDKNLMNSISKVVPSHWPLVK